jgi:hypothetical protein
MRTRPNFARISLAVLWIATGLFFGGLRLLAAPTQEAEQASGQAHGQSVQVHSTNSTVPRA